MALGRHDIRGRRPVWLLDLDVNGHVFRFATIQADVTDADGNGYRYEAGLEDFDLPRSQAGANASIGVTVTSSVDWPALLATGATLERAPAVLRRWYAGLPLERARVVLRGLAVASEYGAVDEPIALSIRPLPAEQADVIPWPQARVDSSTFPTLAPNYAPDEKIEGSAYPIVIGAPGNNPGGVALATTPGLMVNFRQNRRDSQVMIAGHRVEATDVYLADLTDSPIGDIRPVSLATDQLGREYAYVDFNQPSGLNPTPDRAWYVGWEVGGGGLVGNDGNALRGAGDLILYWLRRFTRIPYDQARLSAELERLNRYQIDTVINAEVNAWDWLEKNVVSLLPVLALQSAEGLYYRVVDWRAGREDSIAALSADRRQIRRLTPVRTNGAPVYNEVAIEFAPFATSRRYRRKRIISRQAGEVAEPTPEQDTRILSDRRARLSQDLYGVKPFAIKTSAVWDTATAVRIARDVIAKNALPKRQIGYEGGSELEAFDIGDIVTVTDSEIALADAPAIVFDVVSGAGNIARIDVVLLDDPDRGYLGAS
jgi:hypothetical protein